MTGCSCLNIDWNSVPNYLTKIPDLGCVKISKPSHFYFVSKSKKLMLKSANTIFFRFSPFFENVFLKLVSHRFISPLGGL